VQPLLAAADLLYSGPWLAERWLAFGDKLVDDPAVDPTVRSIVHNGAALTAADAFAGFDRLAVLARASEHLWTQLDALLLPVTPEHPTLAEVAADPIGVNSRLGRFTNMVNLLDLCAVAFPGPDRSDGLPFGIQLLAPAGHDRVLIDLAATWCGEPAEEILLAVAGAHLSGQPLNHELVRRGGRLAFDAPGGLAAFLYAHIVVGGDDDVSSGNLNSGVQGGAAALDRLVDVSNWNRRPVRKVAHESGGVIGRVVVDDDQFPAAVGPESFQTLERSTQLRCTVEGRDDNGEPRRRRHGLPSHPGERRERRRIDPSIRHFKRCDPEQLIHDGQRALRRCPGRGKQRARA